MRLTELTTRLELNCFTLWNASTQTLVKNGVGNGCFHSVNYRLIQGQGS